MGNKAVITTSKKDLGVYLHWNGGRDSVEAFLAVCKKQGYRTPESDNYGWARLCQVICNFFPDGLCVGIDKLDRLDCDNHDNGVYIIENWEIIGREFNRHAEQQNYPLDEMIKSVQDCQPKPAIDKIYLVETSDLSDKCKIQGRNVEVYISKEDAENSFGGIKNGAVKADWIDGTARIVSTDTNVELGWITEKEIGIPETIMSVN